VEIYSTIYCPSHFILSAKFNAMLKCLNMFYRILLKIGLIATANVFVCVTEYFSVVCLDFFEFHLLLVVADMNNV